MRFALRNRPYRERKMLSLLRGASLELVPDVRRRKGEAIPKAEHLPWFSQLRRIATDHGLTIRSPDWPYVHTDEFRLLSWLAEAQRVAGPGPAPTEPDLRAAILRCAGLLDGMGMRLAPLTLYGARLRLMNG